MTILLLGRGGREHALAAAIAETAPDERLVVAPGNPGIAAIADRLDLDIVDPEAVVAAARRLSADLVVVGPEAPLAAGVSDALAAEGILCFGPSKAAARLETSKSFAKEVLRAAGASTARARVFSELAEAEAHIRDQIAAQGPPIVIKADGLAAGKGVVVAASIEAAITATRDMFGGRFGQAGARVLVEEALRGEELSVFAITDGDTARIIGSAQDHKRAFDGDRGPNTGGMGAFAPAPLATPELESRVLSEIIAPVLAEMRRRGTPYRGVLYVGLMIDAAGPGAPRLNVIEFNARLGDPEAQVILPRLKADLPALMRAAARGPVGGSGDGSVGGLDAIPIEIAAEAALCVVLASPGYPGAHVAGDAIGGLAAAAAVPGARIFHAGTRQAGGELVSVGGRVLGVTALGPDLRAARERAYAAVAAIEWPGAQFRKDIGWRALGR